ncbi:MAG: coproporphyrinogen III oxidase family protein [Bacteroidales bacterium]|nr:coproporphyrinogen III oxidase family protein [Bacteroidales bacterium]
MVYLHVPFCRSFCTYCDFYSEIACRGRDAQLFEAYTDAVCAEASRRRDEIEATRDLDTLYIGGGTPSVLPLPLLRQMAAHILTGGVPPELVEFTIEVNPEDIVERGPEYIRGLLGLGVNRVSMGVQSLDDGILHWMNRRHDAAHARQAFRILRGAGVDNVSVDLIFGLSQLSLQTLDATVSEILEWRPEHISAYQLSIEEGSALGEMVRHGRYIEAPQEQCAAQYALLCERLRAAGYVHYEISNWALPGREAVHNSAYWARHPYVGLGPGAHSFDGTTRSWNNSILPPQQAATAPGNRATLGIVRGGTASEAQRWGRAQRDVSGGSWPLRGGYETLSAAEAREEEIFLGLRTARGIPEGLCDPEKAAAALADGRLVRTGDRLRIPEDRWFVSDDILTDLI